MTQRVPGLWPPQYCHSSAPLIRHVLYTLYTHCTLRITLDTNVCHIHHMLIYELREFRIVWNLNTLIVRLKLDFLNWCCSWSCFHSPPSLDLCPITSYKATTHSACVVESVPFRVQLDPHFFNCLHTFFLFIISFQNCTHKSKNCTHKMQNALHILQTFVLCCIHLYHNITFLDISYTHSYSTLKTLLSWAPLYISVLAQMLKYSWLTRKQDQKHFFSRHLWLWIHYYTVRKKECSRTETKPNLEKGDYGMVCVPWTVAYSNIYYFLQYCQNVFLQSLYCCTVWYSNPPDCDQSCSVLQSMDAWVLQFFSIA